MHAWCYGLRRFYSKEDIVSPESNNIQLISKNQLSMFHDIRFAFRITKDVKPKDTGKYFREILLHAS